MFFLIKLEACNLQLDPKRGSRGSVPIRSWLWSSLLLCFLKIHVSKLVSDTSGYIEILIRGDSIITSRPASRWVYTFFVILRDGKLGGWVVLD